MSMARVPVTDRLPVPVADSEFFRRSSRRETGSSGCGGDVRETRHQTSSKILWFSLWLVDEGREKAAVSRPFKLIGSNR